MPDPLSDHPLLPRSDAMPVVIGPWQGADVCGEPTAEYQAAAQGIAITDRGYRGLLEITGADRASWLQNLITNHVKSLQPGDGNYAFAANVKGRILFDLIVLVRPQSLWLDIDRRWIDAARAHLEKYIIMEDVRVIDRSSEFARVALLGPRTPDRLGRLPFAQLTNAPLWQHGDASIDNIAMTFFRSDFCGPFAIDFLVPLDRRDDAWRSLQSPTAATPIGYRTTDVLRIESAIAWPITEINDDVLPAETGLLDHAVSFNKGCYLGQEIIERMRSRGALARQLVLLRLHGHDVPPHGAHINAGDVDLGPITSSCASPRFGNPVALGFVRSASARPGAQLVITWNQNKSSAEVIAPPPSH